MFELYGILTPRAGDTFSERVWNFLKGGPARLGLVAGLVGFFCLTLVRFAYQVVYGHDSIADALKFASGLAFILPATAWLCLHFYWKGDIKIKPGKVIGEAEEVTR